MKVTEESVKQRNEDSPDNKIVNEDAIVKKTVERRPSDDKMFGDGILMADTVTVCSSGGNTPDGSLSNFVVVSTPSDRNKANTSTITINNSDLPDLSNSLASNVSQVSCFIFLFMNVSRESKATGYQCYQYVVIVYW